MKQCTCFATKAINCICDQLEDENSFAHWFYGAPHRIKYLRDSPVYLAAKEAWEAAHEACAKACEEHPDGLNMMGGAFVICAKTIRARGQQ